MAWLAGFLGWPLLWAGGATGIAWAAARLGGRPLRPAALLALGLSAFFLLLTILPLPDPRAVACPVPGTRPNLVPLAFVGQVVGKWQWGPGVALLTVGPVSAAANLVLCLCIGLALARAGVRPWAAAALGAALSLGAELTQLTGLWGLYPCPVRQFDVDDLILNVGGVAIGALLGRRAARPGPVDGGPRLTDPSGR